MRAAWDWECNAGIIACMTDFRGEQGATGARESDESVQDKCGMPIAKRVPKERVFHGDTFIDEYEWLRDKESHDVQDYVAAQNRYCEQRMEPLKTLRSTLFDELKSHVQENDMSVPTRMDGYWYFVRTPVSYTHLTLPTT